MHFTAPQQQLIRLARTPVQGLALTVIKIEEYGAGLTAALKHLEHGSGDVRARVLDGVTPWDALCSLAKKTGLRGNGSGYFNTLQAALAVLTETGKRPAALWLEEARLMSPGQRERIFAHFAYIAEHCGCDLRLAFLIGRVSIWDQAARARKSSFPALGNRLLHRAEEYTFSRAGLSKGSDLAAFNAPRGHSGEQVELTAVAS